MGLAEMLNIWYNCIKTDKKIEFEMVKITDFEFKYPFSVGRTRLCEKQE